MFGFSIAIYFFMFLSGCVGNLVYQSLYPWLTRYEERNMIACRSGGDAGNALVALVAFYQKVGSLDIAFSPSTFLVGVGLYLLVFPLSCFYLIKHFSIGLNRGAFSPTAEKQNLLARTEDKEENKISLVEVI